VTVRATDRRARQDTSVTTSGDSGQRRVDVRIGDAARAHSGHGPRRDVPVRLRVPAARRPGLLARDRAPADVRQGRRSHRVTRLADVEPDHVAGVYSATFELGNLVYPESPAYYVSFVKARTRTSWAASLATRRSTTRRERWATSRRTRSATSLVGHVRRVAELDRDQVLQDTLGRALTRPAGHLGLVAAL